jgi:hypothetical protein
MTKSAPKKPKVPKAQKTTASGAATGTKPKVVKQPQSKPLAAVQAHLYLHTDDAWSLAYFDPDDMHHRERTLFAKR